MGKSDDKTQVYKVQPSKKDNKTNSKNNKKGKKKKHKVLKRIILTLFILIILAVLAGVSAFAAVFFSDKWAITKEELIANGNTEIYDIKENQIALLNPGEGNGNRKVVTLDQMGDYTANAYIAIEDKRFDEHPGVDILRTAKATVSYILNKGSSDVGGGSTITQQLVKNIMKDKADTGTEGIERKIREMSRAYHIEQILTKPQIIEKYLNVIFVGGSDLHGVEYGAQYYFAKPAKDLDLAESAFLAGINNAPNMYDPYDEENDHSELIKSRTKLVLNFMKEQNRICKYPEQVSDPEEAEELYNEAIAKVEEGLEFKKGTIEIGTLSYFANEAVKNAASDLAEQKDIDYDEAENIIRSGGYKLYTTLDPDIQEIVLKEMSKDKYGESRTVTVKEDGESKKVKYKTEAGMTVMEAGTGEVVAIGGALRGVDDGLMNTNYAKTGRQTGSSIKPLANLAPGLEEKVITAATVYDDTLTDFNLGYNPKNAGSWYQGLCTVRKAIEVSSNVVNLKIFSNIGKNTVINYLHEFGLKSYNADEDGLTLAIGGATNTSSTLEMAAAYSALENDGLYIKPTFYKRLEDRDGNTVLEPNKETKRVISEANAFIVKDILTDVVTGSGGTAKSCAISGMDVAAKTGTTDDAGNKWLCGFTNYYVAATWYGYAEDNHSVNDINTAKNIWANVMKEIHKQKDLKGSRFEKPDSVVTAKVCKQSGMLATSSCSNTYTEYFAKGTVPEKCDGHVKVKLCKETGKVATEYCIETEEKYYTQKPEKEANAWWKVTGGDKYKVPTEKCDVHTAEKSKITVLDVLGKQEADAKKALAGLNVQVLYEQHSDKANGVVLRQSLAANTKVDKGVTITITVNKIGSSGTTTPSGNTQTPSGGNTQKPNGGTNTQTPNGGTTTPGTNTQKPNGGTTNQGGSTTTKPNGGTTNQGGSTTTKPGGGSTNQGGSTTTKPSGGTTNQGGSTTTKPTGGATSGSSTTKPSNAGTTSGTASGNSGATKAPTSGAKN